MAVREPLTTALCPGPPAPAACVAAALARSLAPAEADDAAPGWLWPEQIPSFRRAVSAVRCYRGALLADPVGSGKTYVALAVAATINGRKPTACLVPATLVKQWEDVARRLGLSVSVWSHQRLSRGSLPAAAARLVVVDESHHFRNPLIKRYGHLARWLVGRSVLLVSASPVVNRLADLQHQLALTVRDDALARHGVVSLADLLQSGQGHPALGHVIVGRPATGSRRPAQRERAVSLADEALAPLRGALAGVDRLRLSTQRPIAALVRAAFWRSAASSPAALLASVDRYRRLLLHARDAARAGQILDRRMLRAVTNELDDQLLLWELMEVRPTGSELAIEDLRALDEIRAAAAAAAVRPDPKLAQLRGLLADGRCTLVFTSARETVRYLRDRLGEGPIGWCTGERAGVGRQAAPRQIVLDWFRPPIPPANNGRLASLIPRHLVATDVAAEGLDLQRAERVVHYDLPWTPARLEQREGRARRAGAAHREIETVRFEPPPVVERRLRQLACLAGKRGLPTTVGLGESGRALWRWRVDLADRFREALAMNGVARLRSSPEGVLAGFTLHAWPHPAATEPLASWLLWWDAERSWTDDPAVIADRLDAAALHGAPHDGAETEQVAPSEIEAALARLAGPIRERMRQLRRTHWLDRPPSASARTLITRLQALARTAARQRDGERLARLQSALHFAASGHTAGERALVARLADAPDRELEQASACLPCLAPAGDTLHCRVTGLILFAP